MVSCIETLLIAMHLYFVHSPERHIEFEKLAASMNGNKILQNDKTQWISMLKPTKRVMQQYPVLLMKMQNIVKPTATNLDHLLDI